MTKEKLFELYKQMKRISLIEDAIASRYNGEIRNMHTPIHLSNGQEAVAVGICSCLKKEDVIFSNHRSHAHYLAKGGDLKAMIAELHSKETGCCHGKGGSMHLMDLEQGISLSSSIVGGNVPIATGYALSNVLKKKDSITCSFFGDGSSEEGAVYESLCFAQLKNIPIIYICENNQYAINTPLSDREPCSCISKKFEKILRCISIDGNNVESVYETMKDAITWVREKQKPILIECMTYRFRDHSNTGTGINETVRTQEEWEQWKENDPIETVYRCLISEDIGLKKQIEMHEKEVEQEIEDAFNYALNSDFPKVEALYENIY